MNRTLTSLVAALALLFALPACQRGASDEPDALVLSSLLALGILPIAGEYRYFNGTNGTTAEGTYSISQTEFRQDNAFVNDRGAIVEFDNINKVLYFRWTQRSFGAVGEFQWVRWTNGPAGKLYICQDLTSANRSSLAAAKQEFASVLNNPTDIADPALLGVSDAPGFNCLADCGCGDGPGGFATSFWSRLEFK